MDIYSNPETGYDDYPRWNETVECIQMPSFMANRGYQATKTWTGHFGIFIRAPTRPTVDIWTYPSPVGSSKYIFPLVKSTCFTLKIPMFCPAKSHLLPV